MRTNSKIWLACIVGLLGFGALVAPPSPMENSPQPEPPATPTGAPAGVTMADYMALKPGMALEEVIAAIGPGEEQSANNIAGVETVLYSWPGEAWGSSMNAVFQNGRMVQKAQSGLR